jgi:hypothetical protein
MISALLLLAAASVVRPVDAASPGAAAHERLKALVGDWRGSFEWSGDRTGSGAMNASYYLTGNGSALVENLEVNASVIMTTVYHLDGPDLRMTHYCAAGNQPRLKASDIGENGGVVRFAFVDATNLAKPDSPHVHGFEIRLQSDNKVTLVFTFEGGGKKSYERVELTRVGTTAERGSARDRPPA